MTKELQEALNISDEWLLTHRVDLHNTLRAAAAKEVNGKKPLIRLSSRVASVVSKLFSAKCYKKDAHTKTYRMRRLEWSCVRMELSILAT